MGTLRIHRPGLLSTVQDLGRPGLSAIGLPRGGAADPLALRIGNRLIGNPDNAAAIEMTMLGAEVVFADAATICIAGGACAPRGFAVNTPRDVPAGTTLAIGPITQGVRAYLCIAGGIRVPELLGSASTCLSAQFGGCAGRALQAGDTLEFAPPSRMALRALPAPVGRLLDHPVRTLRAVPTPSPLIPRDLRTAFWQACHTISPQSDRTGIRLAQFVSPTSDHSLTSARMITEGMPEGAVQIPPSLGPIILGPDRPTTGGYPVVACIAAVDLHLVGQLRPGEMVRFERTVQAEALAALRERERMLDRLLPPIA